MKLLIFDVWGTVVETGVKPSPIRQVKYFLRARQDFSEFVEQFEGIFMTREFDALQEGFEDVVDAMGLRIPDFVYEKLIGMWNKNAILSSEYEDTFHALEDLKKDYKLALLANIDKFSWEQLKQKFELDKYFDKVYLSFETGNLKGDMVTIPQILKDFKVKKEEAILIGDGIESDVKAADNAGIKSLLIDRKNRREYDPKILNLTQVREHIEK